MGPLGNAVSSKNGHDINPLDEVLLVRNPKESLFVPLGKQASSNVVFDETIQGPARYDHRRPQPVPREDLPRGDGGGGPGDDEGDDNPFGQYPAVQYPEMPYPEMYRDLQRRNDELARAANQLSETQRQHINVLTQRIDAALRDNQLQQEEYNKLYELYNQAREQLLMTLEDKQSEVMRINTINALRRMDKILVLFKNIERRDAKRAREGFERFRDLKRGREIERPEMVSQGTETNNDMDVQNKFKRLAKGQKQSAQHELAVHLRAYVRQVENELNEITKDEFIRKKTKQYEDLSAALVEVEKSKNREDISALQKELQTVQKSTADYYNQAGRNMAQSVRLGVRRLLGLGERMLTNLGSFVGGATPALANTLVDVTRTGANLIGRGALAVGRATAQATGQLMIEAPGIVSNMLENSAQGIQAITDAYQQGVSQAIVREDRGNAIDGIIEEVVYLADDVYREIRRLNVQQLIFLYQNAFNLRNRYDAETVRRLVEAYVRHYVNDIPVPRDVQQLFNDLEADGQNYDALPDAAGEQYYDALQDADEGALQVIGAPRDGAAPPPIQFNNVDRIRQGNNTDRRRRRTFRGLQGRNEVTNVRPGDFVAEQTPTKLRVVRIKKK
jgi:hypothetical protein